MATHPILSEIIPEETQGEYQFKHVQVGDYNRLYLYKGNEVIMYDCAKRPITEDYDFFLDNCWGDVLILGLGCGFAIFPLLDNPLVTSITVIENDPTVISMMSPYLPTVTITESDATIYKPVVKYDSILLDIWCEHDIPRKFEQLRRYTTYLNDGGYIQYVSY